LPWHLSDSAPGCSGWAVILDATGKVVGCHPTKAKAQAQLAALNIHAKGDASMVDTMQARATLDESAWDANAAMTACKTAADYNQICAGVKAGDPALRASHALPHHYLGKPANAAGLRAGRQRFGQTEGLTNREAARVHLFETHSLPTDTEAAGRPPRDGIVRALPGQVVMRSDDDDRSHMVGRFAVFDEWAEIDSVFEGHFMERVAPGAFTKTFREHVPKVLFQHGADPELHNKPLGLIEELREDATGAVYDVALFRGLPPLVLDGLAAGAYGSSFRFRVMREDLNDDAEASDHNPDGLPERTIKEADVFEFGPVTFPAYAGATAGIRSLTDEIVFSQFAGDPARLVELIDHMRATRPDVAHDDPAPPAAGPRPTVGRREPLFGQDGKEKPGWMLT
jgi:HK97 family phage prohead protease